MLQASARPRQYTGGPLILTPLRSKQRVKCDCDAVRGNVEARRNSFSIPQNCACASCISEFFVDALRLKQSKQATHVFRRVVSHKTRPDHTLSWVDPHLF